MSYTLTGEEYTRAYDIAKARYDESISSSRKDNHGVSRSFQIDLVGAIGEIGFCRLFNLDLKLTGHVNTFKASDVSGTNIQIRATDLLTGSLIVRNEDDDNSAYFLIVVSYDPANSNAVVKCPGYLMGYEAKNSRWIKSPNGRPPAYFVPQSSLRIPPAPRGA